MRWWLSDRSSAWCSWWRPAGYAYVNHLVSSIPRVKVAYLTVATSGSGQTFLFTANPLGPTGANGQSTSSPTLSELFMLMHINANGKAGGAVTIPGNTVVNVPGHGAHPLYYALKTGGPSLAVETITKLTGVPINHYARIDFTHVVQLVPIAHRVTRQRYAVRREMVQLASGK